MPRFVSFVNPNVAFVFEKLIFFATWAAIGYNVWMFLVLIMIFVSLCHCPVFIYNSEGNS